MKKKDRSSIATKSENELVKLAGDLSGEINKQGQSRFTEQQKNTRLGRELRKKLAVVKTLLRQKQLGGGI